MQLGEGGTVLADSAVRPPVEPVPEVAVNVLVELHAVRRDIFEAAPPGKLVVRRVVDAVQEAVVEGRVVEQEPEVGELGGHESAQVPEILEDLWPEPARRLLSRRGQEAGSGEAGPGQVSSNQVMKSFTVPTWAMRSWMARWSWPGRKSPRLMGVPQPQAQVRRSRGESK
jgi:hypothetical protein